MLSTSENRVETILAEYLALTYIKKHSPKTVTRNSKHKIAGYHYKQTTMGCQVTTGNAIYKKVLWSASWEMQTGRSAFDPRQDGGVFVITKTNPNNKFSLVGGFQMCFLQKEMGRCCHTA